MLNKTVVLNYQCKDFKRVKIILLWVISYLFRIFPFLQNLVLKNLDTILIIPRSIIVKLENIIKVNFVQYEYPAWINIIKFIWKNNIYHDSAETIDFRIIALINVRYNSSMCTNFHVIKHVLLWSYVYEKKKARWGSQDIYYILYHLHCNQRSLCYYTKLYN